MTCGWQLIDGTGLAGGQIGSIGKKVFADDHIPTRQRFIHCPWADYGLDRLVSRWRADAPLQLLSSPSVDAGSCFGFHSGFGRESPHRASPDRKEHSSGTPIDTANHCNAGAPATPRATRRAAAVPAGRTRRSGGTRAGIRRNYQVKEHTTLSISPRHYLISSHFLFLTAEPTMGVGFMKTATSSIMSRSPRAQPTEKTCRLTHDC